MMKPKIIAPFQITLTVILIAALMHQQNALEEGICTGISGECTKDSSCCDGCCIHEKCVSYSENCVKEKNPCSHHKCPPTTACYLQQVQCFRAPCPPIPVCKPVD